MEAYVIVHKSGNKMKEKKKKSDPSLTNTNKKTSLCILSMSKIQPERDSNQDTASSTQLKPLMAAPALKD